MTDAGRSVAQRTASFFDTIRAVGAAFFGVRGRRAHERDLARLNPLHVVAAGLLMAVVLVLTLVAIVRAVVA